MFVLELNLPVYWFNLKLLFFQTNPENEVDEKVFPLAKGTLGQKILEIVASCTSYNSIKKGANEATKVSLNLFDILSGLIILSMEYFI